MAPPCGYMHGVATYGVVCPEQISDSRILGSPDPSVFPLFFRLRRAVVLYVAAASVRALRPAAAREGSGKTGGQTVQMFAKECSQKLLAWLARKPPTLVQHFPAIHGDSAQTKGAVLLGIVSSS